MDEDSDAVGDGVERVGVERQVHAAERAVLVHEDPSAGIAGDVLEEEGRAAGFVSSLPKLGGAVGDLSHLEVRADRFADAAEFAGFVELPDPFAKVGIGQWKAPDERVVTRKNRKIMKAKGRFSNSFGSVGRHGSRISGELKTFLYFYFIWLKGELRHWYSF
jgi:hypothetical protein